MNEKMLPSFYGTLEVLHYIKGRVRFKAEILKNNTEKSLGLESNLSALQGIKSVRISPVLGTVLVTFDEAIIEPVILEGVILNFLDLEDEAFGKKSGKVFSALREFAEMTDLAVYNKTKGLFDIKTIIVGFFIIYGIKKLRQNPVMPNGINMLWWAYNMLTKGGN